MIKRIGLACVSGVLAFLACSPYADGIMAYVALVPLFFALRFPSDSPRQSFYVMLIYGLMLMGGLYGWIFSLTAWAPLWGVSLAWIVIVGFQALFYGTIGLLYSLSARRWQVPAFFCFYLGLEWLREIMGPFGSSLGQLGYSQVSILSVMQISSVIGVIGVSGVILLSNYVFFMVFIYIKRLSSLPYWVYIAFLVLIGITTWGHYRLVRHERYDRLIKVAIVQGNHPQALKFSHARQWGIWNDYFQLISSLPSVDIILLPETVTPGLNLEAPYLMHRLRTIAAKHGATMMFGTPIKSESLYYNGLATISVDGVGEMSYKKSRLMPFGEYWPFRSCFIAFGLSSLVGEVDYHPAPAFIPLITGSGVYGPLICLESTYSECARLHAAQGAMLLVSIANNAWFIGSRISDVHMAMTQSRAIETGLPLVHVSNQGISGVISNRGIILKSLPHLVSGATWIALPLISQPTIFVKIGYLFAPLMLLIGCGLLVIRHLRRS